MVRAQFLAALLMMSETLNSQNINFLLKSGFECEDDQLPYTGEGKIINSPLLNGLDRNKAISKIIEYFENNEIGNKSNYKIRD